MARRPDPRILATARLVENLAWLMPDVRHHAALELAHVTSLPDHTVGASNPDETPTRSAAPTGRCTQSKPSPLDPTLAIDCGRPRPCPDHDTPVKLTRVERAADERLRIEHWLGDIEARCNLIASSVKDALDSGRNLIGTRTPNSPRCDATGRDGNIEWADPTCTSPPTRGPLCDRCSKREYRWRTSHGLPPRTDGVFSAERWDASRHGDQA